MFFIFETEVSWNLFKLNSFWWVIIHPKLSGSEFECVYKESKKKKKKVSGKYSLFYYMF